MGFDSLMPLWPALYGEQLLCGFGSVLCLCCTKKSQTSFRQTKLERLFSPRLFAAEMLFHKALSFGHRQVQWPSSMLLPRPHPPQEGCFEMDLGILMGPFRLQIFHNPVWAEFLFGYFCRERGMWWGFEYGSRAGLFLP